MSFRLAVKAQPGAKRNGIAGWVKDANGKHLLKITVTAPPENNKANDAIISLLAKHLHVAKGKIRVISGTGSRSKMLEIDGNESDFLEKLK